MSTATARKINPDDIILSGEAFKKTKLTMKDIDNAVKTVRRKAYEKKK